MGKEFGKVSWNGSIGSQNHIWTRNSEKFNEMALVVN